MKKKAPVSPPLQQVQPSAPRLRLGFPPPSPGFAASRCPPALTTPRMVRDHDLAHTRIRYLEAVPRTTLPNPPNQHRPRIPSYSHPANQGETHYRYPYPHTRNRNRNLGVTAGAEQTTTMDSTLAKGTLRRPEHEQYQVRRQQQQQQQ